MAWPKGKPRPENSGRKAGTPNKRSLSALEVIQNCGTDPLGVLCDLMVNSVDESIKMQAAKEVAQYIYSKRPQGVHVSGNISHDVIQIIEQLKDKTVEELDQIIEAEFKQVKGT